MLNHNSMKINKICVILPLWQHWKPLFVRTNRDFFHVSNRTQRNFFSIVIIPYSAWSTLKTPKTVDFSVVFRKSFIKCFWALFFRFPGSFSYFYWSVWLRLKWQVYIQIYFTARVETSHIKSLSLQMDSHKTICWWTIANKTWFLSFSGEE